MNGISIAHADDIVTRFLRDLNDLAPATRRSYERDALQHLTWLRSEGETPHSISLDQLSNYICYLSEGVCYRPTTVARKLAVVRQLYAALHIDIGAALTLPETPRPGQRLDIPWTETALPDVYADTTGRAYRDRAILALAHFHALPRVEIARLTWQHCSLKRDAASLLRRGNRIVTMEDSASLELHNWHDAAHLLGLDTTANARVFVTLDTRRAPLSDSGIKAIIRRCTQ